ncbi:MAG TPA: Fur family transcriptional regulator [Candidatus Saccharimonadales bacterium]
MVSPSDEFIKALDASDLSLTKPRLLVFDTLSENGPLSMKELVERIDGKIDRASVYRIITVFEELGIVNRINIGWKYKIELSEKFSSHHHHLNCLRCGKTIDIEPPKLVESAIEDLAHEYQFEIKSHQIDVTGICHDCQLKDPRKGSPDL